METFLSFHFLVKMFFCTFCTTEGASFCIVFLDNSYLDNCFEPYCFALKKSNLTTSMIDLLPADAADPEDCEYAADYGSRGKDNHDDHVVKRGTEI